MQRNYQLLDPMPIFPGTGRVTYIHRYHRVSNAVLSNKGPLVGLRPGYVSQTNPEVP